MNKLIKSTLSLLIVGLMSTPIQAMAISNISTKINVSNKETIELMNQFSHLKESLDKNTNGKLIASNDTYIKITPKDDVKVKKAYSTKEEIKKDFNIETCNKEQYENATKHKRTRRSSEYKKENQTSWLKMTLQVYGTNTPGHLMAYNFCSWLTNPICRFGEAIVIKVGDGLIISNDSSSRTGSYEYADDNEEGVGYKQLNVFINENGKGGIANFYLGKSTKNEFHNAMIQVPIEYNNRDITDSSISGYYLHKQLSFGDISLDDSGSPSISLNVNNDSVQTILGIGR